MKSKITTYILIKSFCNRLLVKCVVLLMPLTSTVLKVFNLDKSNIAMYLVGNMI